MENPNSPLHSPTPPLDSDIPDLPQYALDLEAEEAFGPLPCTPAAGILLMTARIAGLHQEIADALAVQKGTPEEQLEFLEGVRQRVLPQIADARRRLAEYRLLLHSQN